VLAVAFGALAVVIDRRMIGGLAGLAVLALAQTIWSRRPPAPAKVLGITQTALGLGLVVATAVGVWA
jgi:hypothetical protein